MFQMHVVSTFDFDRAELWDAGNALLDQLWAVGITLARSHDE